MKNSLLRSVLLVTAMSAVLGLSAPLFGEAGDALNQALDLVHKAWNPAGDPPPNDQRTDLLNKAYKLCANYPDHRLKGHRVAAMRDIKAALDEIQKGDPDKKATEFIHNADSELRTATSISD
jgi:hypothetical protein